MKLNKKALSIALGAVVCSFVGVASAHDYVGSINASASANRHDLIQTTCFSWGMVFIRLPRQVRLLARQIGWWLTFLQAVPV
jgi:hypothetical protein